MELFGMKIAERQEAYRLLAAAARQAWGLEELPEIARRPEGKPYFLKQEELEFNLSHSGDLALCALDRAPVGADIQVVKAWRPSLPGRVCSREEQEWLAGQPDRWRAFALLWAMKESRVKESGRGLRGEIRRIRVPLMEEGGHSRMDGLWFRTYGGENWVASVCGAAPPAPEIRWLDGE